jgi:hypothetical protein
LKYYELEDVFYRIDEKGFMEVWAPQRQAWVPSIRQDTARVEIFGTRLNGEPQNLPRV